jgi:hypothetical protein
MIAKPIFIKLTGGKTGRGALKAAELTSGDLRHVRKSWLKVKEFTLIVSQKSAKRKIAHDVGKATMTRSQNPVFHSSVLRFSETYH